MATLKDHQQAMVDMLASGSGIPASASRLAHAMHDVLSHMISGGLIMNQNTVLIREINDATTPGLNDKALAGDIEACRPKATSAERRVKELENTIRQLKASNAKLKSQNEDLRDDIGAMASKLHTAEKQLGRGLRGVIEYQEKAGCRKPDTQVCEPQWVSWSGGDCPLPADTIVEVKFYDRQTESGSKASAYVWRHGALGVRDLDIIAYRVLNK